MHSYRVMYNYITVDGEVNVSSLVCRGGHMSVECSGTSGI